MTRRLTIVLDDSVTESSCGECRWSFRPPSVGTRWPRTHCRVFGLLDGSRAPKCLEAERAAARMVEIDPALAEAGAIHGVGPDEIDAFLGAAEAESEWDEAPHVCPGCYAVGEERCAPGCIDAEIAEEHRHAIESGDYDEAEDDDA